MSRHSSSTSNVTVRAANPTGDWPPAFFARVPLLAYKGLGWAVFPFVAIWMGLSKKRRPLLRRFRPSIPPFDAQPLWIHACSVGEVNVARPLLDAIGERWPALPLLLTVSTPTGFALARDIAGVPVAWFPLDHPRSVRRFFRRANPRALLLIETELWPNVLAEAHRCGVPVAIVNGRLSDKHARSYRRLARLWKPLLRPVALAAMQSDVHAERIAALGVKQSAVHVTGNIKFDAVATPMGDDAIRRIKRDLAIPEDAPVLVFGSTRPGDEALAAECWKRLQPNHPELRLIIAPRHLDRIDEAMAPFAAWPTTRRSQQAAESERDGDARIIFLDTHGELASTYGVATVAIVGGSFHPGVDGHNPLEPAAQGVPTIFGPYMRNFGDSAHALIEHGGALTAEASGLADALDRFLEDSGARAALSTQARSIITTHQGAVDRTISLIEAAKLL